jgi:magnesium-protoporphyrin IX monomethyl ester (oxidative) cyclase
MLKIVLLNMPFAAYHLPSIGLTQIKAVLDSQLGDRVETKIVYANLDFAAYMGLELYETITSSADHLQAGFPEWFFRHLAFPQAPDNSAEYFARYYPAHDPATQAFLRTAQEKRRGAEAVLDSLIDLYELDRADIVGFTSMFFENMVAFAMARKIKERNPRVITALGGATSESPSGEEWVRQVEALDFVVSGPGLKSFPRLVANCLEGRMEENHRIPGVFSRVNLGQGVSPMADELDIDVPIELDYGPFLQALEEKLPAWDIKAVLPFETSRGCWWGERAHCTFCGLNKNTMGYRAMRPDLAVELIRSLFRFADRTSVIMCVDNILQRQYIKEVFPYLDTPPETPIFYQLKANLNESEVAAMARANLKLITPGFESLSTGTLKLMDKGVTAFHNLQVMKYCVLYDVHPGWNILVGSPGEPASTYEKYTRDLPLLVHLPAPQGLYSIHFNRYSPYHMHPERWGLDLVPLDFYAKVYPFPPESIANIAYDFTDQNLEAEYLQALVHWIDPVQEKVRAWQSRWAEENPAPQPHLYLHKRGEETWIYDSRFAPAGDVREYPVTPAVRQLLAHLDETRKVSSLAAGLGHVEGLDLERDLAFLRERGLLFEEDGKALSLVLHSKPPEMTYRASALGVRKRLKETAPLVPAMGPITRTARRAVKPGAARTGA